jgi:hypothetical protein
MRPLSRSLVSEGEELMATPSSKAKAGSLESFRDAKFCVQEAPDGRGQITVVVGRETAKKTINLFRKLITLGDKDGLSSDQMATLIQHIEQTEDH